MKNYIRALKKADSEERGQVLILVLMVLLVGALLMGALMGLVSTGIKTGTVYKNRANTLYAADSGIQDAVLQLHNPTNNPLVPTAVGTHTQYQLNVNGIKIVTTIEMYDSTPTYKVTAVPIPAANPNSGVTAFLPEVSFTGFAGYA